jgi:hypothetical protein
VSPVKYELGFYIPEDGILHSHRREHLRSYRKYSVRNADGTMPGRTKSATLHYTVPAFASQNCARIN